MLQRLAGYYWYFVLDRGVDRNSRQALIGGEARDGSWGKGGRQGGCPRPCGRVDRGAFLPRNEVGYLARMLHIFGIFWDDSAIWLGQEGTEILRSRSVVSTAEDTALSALVVFFARSGVKHIRLQPWT